MKINHVLVQTTDLQAMTSFLKNVTGLEEGYRPPFPFPGAWIYSNGKPLLHIVKILANNDQKDCLGSVGQSNNECVFDHIAFEGDDYIALIERLKSFGITYTERTVPMTKEHQVFIVGPDNVKLEMIFNEDKDDFKTIQSNNIEKLEATS